MPTLDEIVAAAPDPRDPAASQPTALDRAVAAAPPKRQTITDYARQLQRGATSAFQTAPAQVASMLGAPRTAVDEAQAAEKSITERLSPQARFITETPVYDAQQGWHPAAGQAILSAAVESAPSLVQSYIAGRPLFDVLGRAGVGQRVAGAAQRAGIPKRAAGIIGRAAEATPFAMVEGGQAGAMAAAQQGQQVRGLDETKLLAAPGYEDALAGTDPALPVAERVAAAREALAQQAERQALAMTAASTGGIGALTSGGVIGQFARRLAGRTGIDAAKDTALRALARGAGAEALQEAPQSAAEQAIGNLITQRLVDSGQEIDEGVLNAAITGGAAGGLLGGLGGGAGYLARPRQRDELVDESAGPQRQPGSAVVEPPAPPVDPGAGPMSKAVVVGQTEGAIPTNAIGGPVDAPPEQPAAPAGPAPEVVAEQQAREQQRVEREHTAQMDAAEKQMLALNDRIAKAHEQALKAAENGDEEGVERAEAMAEAMRDRLAQVQDRMRRMRHGEVTQPGIDDAAIGPSRSAAVPRSDMGADLPGARGGMAAGHGAAGDAQPDGGRGVRVPAEPSSALARLEGGAAAARDGEGAGAVGGLSVSFGGKSYPVDSLEDAAEKWSQFRDTSGAGASEVGNGVSVVDAAGNEVGRVSYNGRIWRDGAASAPQASRSDVRTEVDDWLQGMTPMARADAMRAAGVESAATESDLAKLRDVMRADLADAQRQFDAQQAATPLNAGATPLTAPETPLTGGATTAVDAAAAQSPSSPSNGLPEPSKAQKEAGNYPKPPVQISGLTIRVENEAGTRRAPEYPTMKAHYGYFQGTKASDEEGVDVFVKPGTSDAYDGPVFVIDGLKRDGSYDEAKVMLGWEKKAGALASYRGSYEKGWKVGPVTQMTMAEFKAWLKDGDTTKPLAAQPAPKRSREEVSRERKRAYREANPFRAFLAEHGVATADRSDVGGERNRPVMVPYHGPLFRKTGLRLDELARRAVEAGFLTQADIDSDLDNGGVNKLSDMIRRMLAGERILPVTAAESEQEAQWRAQMDARYEAMQEAEDAIVEQASDDEINALLQLASDEDAEASNEEIDYIAGQERLGGETQEGAAGDAPRGDSRGGAEARAESPGEVDDDLSDIPFDLERQSDADVRQQEAQRRKDEAKAEREAAEQAKRDAAPPPEDFTLAGSDRPADQAAARGQQELAPAARTPEQIIDEYRKEYAKFSNLRPGLTLEQWRAAHDDIRAAENAAAQALVDIAERDGLSMKSAHNDNTLMLTPDPTSGGRTWRVTNFLPDGTPAGHMEYNSALEAAKSLLHDARGTKTDDRYSPPRQRVPSDGMPEGADEAVRKHGLEGERVGWTRGKGLNANRWAASVGNMQGNYRDTADEAVASLREFLDAARRREEGDARQRQAAQAAADKIKRGEQPTDAEWAAIFPGWREGHRYVRQPAASWFLTEFLGVPKHNIRANIGAAAGTLTSDSGAEYPIVYPKKLRDVFGRRDGQPIGRDGLTDAERASNRLDGIASELSGVIQEEASQQDFVPSEIPTVIEQWAKDNEVDAGDLRTRVLDRLRKRLSEGRMRQVERSLSGEKPSVAANRKPGIADFGEKIEGARKDVWASFRDKMQQAGTVDIAAEPLSKSWPAPDYQALLDEGADPWAIAFMHAARDAIPTKPQKKWKVRAWVDSVRLLRDVSMGLADGSIDRARAQALLAEAEKTSRGMSDIAGRIELYQLVGHSKSLAGVRLSRGEYSLYNGVEHKPPKVIWTVEKQAAATAFSNWPRQLASGDTKERALANFKEKFDALEIGKPAAKDTTFEVYSKRGENGYWVGKKVGRNPILLEGPFGTLKEARTYKDTHNAELTAKLEKSKEIPSERRDTNEPRVGEDMRGGADVTPEMFQETFSFKGVQFGNYVEQSRRQKDLNEAYDALMDMAAVLGVPPKALSLNGELGLAFGARGKGGKGAAAAHYERGHVVINLTKREGAGSLGHEWWHALDNYFARMRGLASDDMTESSDVGTASHTGKFVHRGDVRREMVAAFGEVLRAIRSTAIKARSSKLDAKRTKAYWTTSAEMSARAYESYLISKLQDQGASNDYLANIVDEATWAAAEKLGFELEESYPYPTAGEVPAIRAAFDHFFQTVQTRETDRGLAIFEPTAQYRVDEPQGTQTDLFGVPGEPGENRRTRPDRTRVRGNVQPAAALSDTEAPAGEYFLRTILGTETSRQLGASVIQTHADAARATKYLYRNAVERFDGIVTDKDGKPLAVVGGFKGALSQASVYPATLIGEAVRIPGAARIWFSHNHPSGTAELSGADRTLHRALNSVFRGSGIEPMGLLAVAGDSYAFEGTSPSGLTGDVQNNLPIYGKDERVEVPVVERMIAPDGVPGKQILTPTDAREVASIFYGRTKEPGLVLLSAQNRVVAWVPLSSNMIGKLRGTGGLRALYRSVSESTVGGAIIVQGGELSAHPGFSGVSVVQNIGAALKQAEVTTLDAINVVTGHSQAEHGASLASGPVYSRRDKSAASRGDTGMPVAEVTGIVDAARKAWVNAPPIVVVESLEDSRVPQAVRDADTRSDRGAAEGVFHDGTVYLVAGNLATEADVVRVLMHESLGHHGLRGVFGDSLNAVLDKVVQLRRADVVAKMRQYRLQNTVDGRRTAAEEVLASLAQTEPQLPLVRAAIAAIRSWLRRVFPNLRLSNDEIARDYLIPARAWVMRGAQAASVADGARFSLSAAPAPTFYSALARRVSDAGPKVAPAAQWQAWLKNQPGVKPAEVEWSGINDFLDMSEGKIAREDVLRFLDENGVRVEEVLLGAPETSDALLEREARRLLREDGIENPTDEQVAEFIEEHGYDIDNVRDAQRLGAAKFGGYRTPGGENYRELLLTLPMSDKFDPAKVTIERRRQSTTQGSLVISYDGKQLGTWSDKIELNPQTKQYEGMTDEQAIGIVQRRFNGDPSLRIEPLHSGFRSSHWDQPNVLAHIRFDERTDADGKRVLFINEIQSDWAQSGRKQGFARPPRGLHVADLSTIDRGFLEVVDENGTFVTNVTMYQVDTLDEKSAVAEAERRVVEERHRTAAGRQVPRAPFVEKTEAWVGLALKRAIRYAVDNGFDRVAIVNGEQAADLFDLSQHITKLYYDQDGRGYILSADSRNGEVFPRDMQYSDEELENVVGKEIAQKIRNREGREDDENGGMVLEGVDLKVGGEGMRGFYDRIVPGVVRDVLKRLGGKLSTVDLTPRTVAPSNDELVRSGQWIAQGTPQEGGSMGGQQIGFDITPAMREAAMAGQPMFSLQEQAPAGTMGQRASDVLRGLTVRDVMHRFGNRLRDLRGVSLQALGRRQIVDIYGDMLPQLRDYDDIAQQMEAEKNEGAAEADGLADRWGKLRNERALAELMHDATLARVDPARDDAGSQLHPEYPALRRRWEALGEQAQAVYLEARDAYRAHYEKVKNEIRLRIRRSIPDSPMRAAMLEEMEATLFADWEGVYFPLARFGDYVVVARDAGGNTVAVSRAESLNEAETMRARMMRTLPASRGYSVGKIIKSREFNAARDGVGRSFLHKLYGVLDEQGALGAELQDSINQLYLSSLPDLSWTKHGIHRKGTPGFSQDARRAFAQNMFHGARYLAKLRHSDRLADSLMAMQEHVDEQAEVEDYDSVAGQQVVDEMTKRHDLFLNPKINPWATAATSAGFVWYLGLSPASAVVNLSQTPLVAYPLMGAKWGFRKAASALERASRETMAAGNDLSKRLKGAELDAFERAVKDGTIDITQAHDLAGIAQGEDQGVVWRMRPIMKAAAFLFHHAEKFNRQATFLAAYRMAKDANPAITEDEAYRQAKDITYKSHFDYAACVDDATEILTTTGWKKRVDLRVGDVAIATDKDGRAVESKVLAVNVYENREVIEFSGSRRFGMVLTPNHDAVIQSYNSRDKKWQSIRKVRADELKAGHHILRAPLAPIERAGTAGIGDDLAALLGWVAAEGWYSKYRNCTEANDVRLGQSNTHNPEYVEEIRGLLDRLGGEYKEYTYARERDTLTTFVLRRILGRRIQEHLPEKKLTPELLSAMSTSEMRAFLMAFLKGDGAQHKDGLKSWLLGQKNGANLDLLQAMATMCGMRASVTPANGNGMAYLYVVTDDPGYRSHVRPLKQVRRTEPIVWCPTTEHGTWIARRNGATFVTGNSNRPRVMQGNIARVVLLFKQFAQNMVYTLARQGVLAAKGDREAAKAFGALLTSHALAAGIFGLPLVNVLLEAASMLGSTDDEPWDAEAALRNYMAEAFGPTGGAAIAHGLSRLTPWDISGRVGLDNLIFPDIREGLEGDSLAGAVAAAGLGPVYSMGFGGPLKGLNLISEGHWLRGLEAMMPAVLRSALKSYRYASEGATTRDGKTIVEDVGAAEWLGQLAGFSPSRVRDASKAREIVFDLDRRLRGRRAQLMRDFGDAVMHKDHDAMGRYLGQVQAFNQANPERAITIESIRRSVIERQRRAAEAEMGIFLPRKSRGLLEQGGFADVQ